MPLFFRCPFALYLQYLGPAAYAAMKPPGWACSIESLHPEYHALMGQGDRNREILFYRPALQRQIETDSTGCSYCYPYYSLPLPLPRLRRVLEAGFCLLTLQRLARGGTLHWAAGFEPQLLAPDNDLDFGLDFSVKDLGTF